MQQSFSGPVGGILFLSAGLLATFLGMTALGQGSESTSSGELNPRLVDRGLGTPELSEKPVFEDLWRLAELYRNDDAPLIQGLSLLGRYHGQWWGVDSAQGDIDDWENRRVWAGARMRFLDEFSLLGNFNLDPRTGANPTRGRDYVDVLNLSWIRDDQFQLVIGHQKPGFSWEYDLSSNRLLTLERSLLVNQIVPKKSTGVMFEQKIEKFQYRVAGYSGQPFGKGLRDPFWFLAAGYDLSGIGGIENMSVQVDYLYNSTAKSATARPYRNSVATSFNIEEGPNAFVAQFLLAEGIGSQSNAWGFTLMPARFLVEDKLQLVARYQFASSSDVDGLQVQNRYERQAPQLTESGKGDRYHAGYLGLNWYLNGHRLKIMTGVEYSHMRGGGNGGGFDGWTGLAGIRMFF